MEINAYLLAYSMLAAQLASRPEQLIMLNPSCIDDAEMLHVFVFFWQYAALSTS